MQSKATVREFAESDPFAPSAAVAARLRIVVVYDDFEAGTWAKQLSDELARHWRESFAVQSSFWKFDVMGIPGMRDLAVMDVLAADCVIVALCGDAKLPPAVTAWIDGWLEERCTMPGLLMALVGTGETGEPVWASNSSYLGLMAARRGLNFVCHAGQWRESAARSLEVFVRARESSLNPDSREPFRLELSNQNK